MKKSTAKLFSKPLVAIAALSGGAAMTAPVTAQAEISGNIGVVSEYLFRGGYENNGTAVQGGIDYSHDSGLYVGYWGSNLDYGTAPATTGFENDVYVGYGAMAGDFSYDVSLLYFYYTGVDDADTPEFGASIGYGPVSLGMAYLIDDVTWGNEGDIYWSLAYETALPSDFGFSATLGYYTYEDQGEFESGLGTTESSGLKHVDLSLSHPLGATGADMSITYMIGGTDRTDTDVEDTVILGVSFGF
ncbi:hypothetical protein Tel_15330 [Candidatus Tenderia electrophaga]|jgi:uncharacterized protein (TIGR02001 family)|uniref:Porin domain-containing protein n=1 Tax=Candidatus Tenderia electrophaga TaxID=1748243 RepID=A0A0S2TGX7_9GAMM|nr:hypothetical protein Tel_15330 [Candidatus Tenderia electrophaga]